MTHTDLEAKVATEHGIKKAVAGRIIDQVVNLIVAELMLDGYCAFPNLGSFKVVDRPERQFRNPQDGTPVTKAAWKEVKFKAAKSVTDRVNGKV